MEVHRVCNAPIIKLFTRWLHPFTFSPAVQARACRSHRLSTVNNLLLATRRVADGSCSPDSHLPNGRMKPTVADYDYWPDLCSLYDYTVVFRAHLVNCLQLSYHPEELLTPSFVHYICCKYHLSLATCFLHF